VKEFTEEKNKNRVVYFWIQEKEEFKRKAAMLLFPWLLFFLFFSQIEDTWQKKIKRLGLISYN
jgi:hypothetical protein